MNLIRPKHLRKVVRLFAKEFKPEDFFPPKQTIPTSSDPEVPLSSLDPLKSSSIPETKVQSEKPVFKRQVENQISAEELQQLAKTAYDKRAMQVVDPVFQKALERRVEEFLDKHRALPQPLFLRNLYFSIFLVFIMCLIFLMWKTYPYTVLFRDLTLSEYTIRKLTKWYTVFTSNLSFKDYPEFFICVPMLYLSFFNLAFYFKSRHIFYLFVVNSIFSSATTICIEKYNQPKDHLMIPKIGGENTLLFFAGLISGISPRRNMFFSLKSPNWIGFVLMLIYEYYSLMFKDNFEQSRSTHILSGFFGLATGFVLKRKTNIFKPRYT